MQIQDFWTYRIFLSDKSDGSFFLNDRLPIFSDWIVANQIHSDGLVDINTIDKIPFADLTQADGFISCVTSKTFGVKLADCNGILLLWETWYAVVHAGWKGLKAGIIEKALKSLINYGEKIENLSILCSPSIRVCCYEVGDEFLDYFPHHCFLQKSGRYHFDGIWYIQDILASFEIPKDHIYINPACTCCDTNFYSYRRDHIENRIVFWVQKTL